MAQKITHEQFLSLKKAKEDGRINKFNQQLDFREINKIKMAELLNSLDTNKTKQQNLYK